MAYNHSVAIANQLKYYRQKSGLTQKQVAGKLNVKRSTYAYYEKGKIIPCIEKIIRIAYIFNTAYTNLLDDYCVEILEQIFDKS